VAWDFTQWESTPKVAEGVAAAGGKERFLSRVLQELTAHWQDKVA
jgi:hypothetical protein